jgi:hypothetical protein
MPGFIQGRALPHEKCYRKETMPQIENVTQIIMRMLKGGRPNGVKHESKTGGNEVRYADYADFCATLAA